MATQLRRLRERAARPGVTVEVLSFAAGAHAAMESAFFILDFPDPLTDPPLVYLDGPSSAAYLEKPGDLRRYATMFDLVRARTVPLEEYA